MEKQLQLTSESQAMTEMQEAVFQTEAFLSENYEFRHNIMTGQSEVRSVADDWQPLTAKVLNSIVRHAKKEGIGGEKSPKLNIEEYINSNAVADYDPVREFLDTLPEWDGRNHVANLFGRIPGITTEQLSWCSTWMRSMVAHWLGIDIQHGNECVPVLIGPQGCGKSTFAVRLLPEHLRVYFLDHINFSNKFDADMALTNNLLVNIDEFANMGPSQQGRLKQTLSKVKVNGRPIFGRSQQDRRRYASFIATTNDLHPLCDTTGSRRYLCLRIPKHRLIDNETAIPYKQLYAQVLHELMVEKIPYWFCNDTVARIQTSNLPYFRTDDMEGMLHQCFRLPDEGEMGEWVATNEVVNTLHEKFPEMRICHATKVRIGQVLRYLGCRSKRNQKGMLYQLMPTTAA